MVKKISHNFFLTSSTGHLLSLGHSSLPTNVYYIWIFLVYYWTVSSDCFPDFPCWRSTESRNVLSFLTVYLLINLSLHIGNCYSVSCLCWPLTAHLPLQLFFCPLFILLGFFCLFLKWVFLHRIRKLSWLAQEFFHFMVLDQRDLFFTLLAWNLIVLSTVEVKKIFKFWE